MFLSNTLSFCFAFFTIKAYCNKFQFTYRKQLVLYVTYKILCSGLGSYYYRVCMLNHFMLKYCNLLVYLFLTTSKCAENGGH